MVMSTVYSTVLHSRGTIWAAAMSFMLVHSCVYLVGGYRRERWGLLASGPNLSHVRVVGIALFRNKPIPLSQRGV